LHWAARYDNRKVIEILCEAGFNITLTDGENRSPMDLAKYHNHTITLEMLLATKFKAAAPGETEAEKSQRIESEINS
jgi:ankyrin repeat protein